MALRPELTVMPRSGWFTVRKPPPIERGSPANKGGKMATPERSGGNLGGIGLGGILVIAGILLALFWSVWVGIIIALIGLIAFGGFARGRWY